MDREKRIPVMNSAVTGTEELLEGKVSDKEQSSAHSVAFDSISFD